MTRGRQKETPDAGSGASLGTNEVAQLLGSTNEMVTERPEIKASGGNGGMREDAHAAEFVVDGHGVPKPTQRNIGIALRRLGVSLSYDRFAARLLLETRDYPQGKRVIDDAAMDALWLRIEAVYGFRPGQTYFRTVIWNEGRLNSFHPVLDYLAGLEWDGVPRLDTWLTAYGGAEDTPFNRAVGRLGLVAGVERIRNPGCKFDEIMTWISAQGMNKSTALALLAGNPDWFTDSVEVGASDKEVIELLKGKWIAELPELSGMSRREVERVKSFASRQTERARLSYGRETSELPRQSIFVGTSNNDRFLRDMTGNRRFWPVRIARFELDALHRDRNQLWAEAVAAQIAGESIRLSPLLYGMAAEVQRAHTIEEPWQELISPYLEGRKGKIKAETLWDIVEITPAFRTQAHNDRLGLVMKSLGWEHAQRRFSGKKCTCYVCGTPAETEIELHLSLDPHQPVDNVHFLPVA